MSYCMHEEEYNKHKEKQQTVIDALALPKIQMIQRLRELIQMKGMDFAIAKVIHEEFEKRERENKRKLKDVLQPFVNCLVEESDSAQYVSRDRVAELESKVFFAAAKAFGLSGFEDY